MKAFLTGSHAYGTLHKDSDVDVCIRVDADTAKQISDALRDPSVHPRLQEQGSIDGAVKEGRLNLIMCTTDAVFEAWRTATAELRAAAPVTRQDAVKLIKLIKSRLAEAEDHKL